MLSHLKNFFLDFLFPIHCISCKQEGQWFCQNCAAKINLNSIQVCPVCRKKSKNGLTCANCQFNFPLTGLQIAASYQKNPELARAIKILKYKFSEPLAQNLGKILTNAGSQISQCIITPVPLHSKRQRWRGFNQAENLAKVVAKNLNLPIENLLTRQRNTPPQAKLNKTEREKNLTGAFAINMKKSLQGKKIILIDDVVSTGSTILECAKVLKIAGASEVWGLVLARG
jgi:ComF family protein